jgi:UDP-2,3-diacylglucosamine pyrophosphatase LpxH
MFGKARYLPLVVCAALAGAMPGSAIAGEPTPPPRPAAPAAPAAPTAPVDPLAARYPDAQLDDKALCDRLIARTATDAVFVDPEPRARRKVIVSDLHLGPGPSDPRFAGIEDFYSEAEWTSFLARQVAAGPTDLIVNGDFIEFWQIAAALGALPKRTDPRQPTSGAVLASDQRFAVTAIELVLAAHRSVFADMGKLLDRGDNRIIIVAGNHDADLLWPKVQLAIARAIKPRDPSRLLFTPGPTYEHAGVHVEHGHAFDAANRFATGHAPFGRDRDGTCRLQSSWGEVFVDQFYTDVERKVPFIDNLDPQSAAILWAMRDNPDPQRDVGAVIGFIDLLRAGESRAFNRGAIASLLQSALGTPGARDTGPESVTEVIEHVADRLARGDVTARALTDALLRLRLDPDLAGLWSGLARAAALLPDFQAASRELRAIDPQGPLHLHDVLFGDPLNTAAARLLGGAGDIKVVVLGHTHTVGGSVEPIGAGKRSGWYANSGSWISAASVAELRARGVGWDRLTLADRTMFPAKNLAVTIEYAGGAPGKPILVTTPPPAPLAKPAPTPAH